jgi:formylglycine-generating enzyme required for sulfatase activity
MKGEKHMEMVEVPAGPFLMGSSNDNLAYDDEKPQHTVWLPAFKIGRYPVTNAEYAAFVEATDRDWRSKPNPENHPVVYVSWYDTQAYAAWLRELTGHPYRLPTEAEWEKAARGTDGRRWPWGDEWVSNRCNNYDGGPRTTTPVGHFSPSGDSPYGCADMAGNVWEWCATKWRESYEEAADESLEGDAPRVVRGGAFPFNPGDVRCASRSGYDPYYWDRSSGFRLVVAPALDSDSLDRIAELEAELAQARVEHSVAIGLLKDTEIELDEANMRIAELEEAPRGLVEKFADCSYAPDCRDDGAWAEARAVLEKSA